MASGNFEPKDIDEAVKLEQLYANYRSRSDGDPSGD